MIYHRHEINRVTFTIIQYNLKILQIDFWHHEMIRVQQNSSYYHDIETLISSMQMYKSTPDKD